MKSEELDELLNAPEQFREIWLEGLDGSNLCALINGDIGWLMYMEPNGSKSFSSINRHISSNERVEFVLNNGQKDNYPANWTYPIDKISEALHSFIQNGEMPSQVEWQNNS